MCVRVCVYQIVHNRAIGPCYGSRSMQLVFIGPPKRGSMVLVTKTYVFFTLTDRVSTIPTNVRRCQSGMWFLEHVDEKAMQGFRRMFVVFSNGK